MNQEDRFDKFTEHARLCLSLAQEAAQHFKRNYIGTEHLLIGLLDVQDGAAIQVLKQLDVDPHQIREAVVGIIGRNPGIVLGEVGLTPRAKRALELAVDESHRLFHGNIGTEHLLLGLIREGDGIAGTVLANMGVTFDRSLIAIGELVGYPQTTSHALSSRLSGMGGSLDSPRATPTPALVRVMFERAFASRSLAEIRQLTAHYQTVAAITQQILDEREASHEHRDKTERDDG